ncbi:hypothetical protein niasHT_031838 [Heterodera trifolii]|uniref:Glutathione synthetase n=1 Tax=Heterodera trifolii TaxID=157864 RepID=A0ABD2HT34_9BILA
MSNGQAERFVDTFKRTTTPSESLNAKSPAEMFLGRKIRTTFDLQKPKPKQPIIRGESSTSLGPNLRDLEVFVEYAKFWAHKIGLVVHHKEHYDKKDAAVIKSFSLFPSPFPRRLFEQAKKVQTAMNLLYFRVSQDFDFLIETLQPLAETTEHIRVWLELLREVKSEGVHQPINLLLIRSDYMCHVNNGEAMEKNDYELKQVEVNIGNYGGAGYASHLTQFHRKMMETAGRNVPADTLPDNGSDEQLAEALYEAWKLFGDPKAIMLIVANKYNRTFEMSHIDQILIKLAKNDNHQIQIVIFSLAECVERLTLDEDNFSLRLDGQIVGVVHLKTTCFKPTPEQIASRRMIERSTAIKCPTAAADLASMKKVQQVLAKPGVLERFFPNSDDAELIAALRPTFAEMWALDKEDEHTKSIIKDATENPMKYVLKPSQEGGGHNFWGEEIGEKLRTFTKEELAAHILMQRLRPMVGKNYLVHSFRDVKFTATTSELSTFGYLLGNGRENTVSHNVSKGHMMRTKPEHINEGGVIAGEGVHDSPFLI